MKRQYELTYVPIGAMARVSFFMFIVFGFLLGIFYGFIFAVMARMPLGAAENPFSGMSPMMMMILFPILGAFFGGIIYTVINIFFFWLYNTVARFAGGVVLELDELEPDGERISSSRSVSPPISGPGTPSPWTMPTNMSSTIGAPSDSAYLPPAPPRPIDDDTASRT